MDVRQLSHAGGYAYGSRIGGLRQLPRQRHQQSAHAWSVCGLSHHASDFSSGERRLFRGRLPHRAEPEPDADPDPDGHSDSDSHAHRDLDLDPDAYAQPERD